MQAYESYLHLHLKYLMTSINKAKVQNITDIKIKKNKCIAKCYTKNLSLLNYQNNNDSPPNL